MKVKTYKAMDMQEAMRQIKEDLGPDAVILSTRKVVDGRKTFGLLGRPMVEVTAALDGHQSISGRALARQPSRDEPNDAFAPEIWELIRSELNDLRREISGLVRANQRPDGDFQSGLAQGLEELRWWASYLSRQWGEHDEGGEADPRKGIFINLVRQGVREVHALRILDRLEQENGEADCEDLGALQKRLLDFLRRLVRVDVPTSDADPLVLALVGPTGVGKTTTAAKIAARCALGENMKVALVTNDTYRIAAVEQLKIYARIMSIPLEVALQHSDLPRILDGFRDKDVVLIDTVGRSPFDKAQMGELHRFLKSDGRIRNLLLVSATSDPRHLERLIQRYSPLKPKGLIVTKLDEATSFGALFSASLQSRLPFAYFTNGQRVPEDLRPARPEEVASWTLWGLPTFFETNEQLAMRG